MRLELRRITENELELMMEWRMREEINRMMYTSPVLTLEGQYKWFEKIKTDPTQIRWIIWADGRPIGSMYINDIDRINHRCESGWFIAEKGGLSLKEIVSIQQNANQYLFENLGMNRIYGGVLDINFNAASLINRLVGLKEEGRMKQHIYKDGRYHDVIMVGITKKDWDDLGARFERIPVEGWYC
ncbi:MAG: GNAT family N-acetyltransferase [Clostridiales bacterium]|nr:GNAT family N-acetyltransferase [Clostridiales bacterium]